MSERYRLDCHKGHRFYVGGGLLDGEVTHLSHALPCDYPLMIGTLLRGGTRSWYELDHEASEGTQAVYRFVGTGRRFPRTSLS